MTQAKPTTAAPTGKARTVLLNKTAVDAETYTGTNNSRCVLWDSKITGFGLRTYPGGRKTFILSYTVGGRKRMMTLCEGKAYGVITVDQARTEALALLAKILTTDADPLGDKERDAQGETMRDLCDAYRDRHAPTKKTGDQDLSRIDRHIRPLWGTRRVTAITRADVARLHGKIGAHAPIEANRILSLLSKMFALARRWGFTPEGHPNPASDQDRFPETHRDRWVTPVELPRLAQAIDAEFNPVARNALWLYLLTGCRKTQLLKIQWADIDWERAELRLPETKARRTHYLPLSEPAMALLRTITQVDGNPYVLPGRGHRGMTAEEKAAHPHHLVNISKPFGRVRAAAGVADVRLHDLRRTVGSWLAQSGNSLHLIGRVLDHTNVSTSAIYARFSDDSVRTALEQHGAQIMAIAGKAPLAEVVALPAKAAKG